MSKVLLVTDTWIDTISGVTSVILLTKKALENAGVEVSVIHPGLFKYRIPLPLNPEIKMVITKSSQVKKMIEREKADYIHIETEGTLGLLARNVCLKNNWNYTTRYHTQLPEYIHMRAGLSVAPTYMYLRWFHKKSKCVMVGCQSIKDLLEKHGFKNTKVVSLGGIDTELFKKNTLVKKPSNWTSPVFVFLGRVAIEKNLRDFLKCDLPGTKLIIGDGPDRIALEQEFRDRVIFTGYKKGQDIVDLLSMSDVFVFPSKTDTYGLVLVEALACEVPIAAYDAVGPRDIITNGVDGFFGPNLKENALKCLEINRVNCRTKALKISHPLWYMDFLTSLTLVNPI